MCSPSAEPARKYVEAPELAPQYVAALDPAAYRRHAIHGEDRLWPETNCYTDLLVELVHGMGHEPLAVMPFTLAIDFEGDQWTFFKPPAADLYDLYGMDLQELAIWRPLVDHVVEQVDAGRPVLVELDSFYLPDTAGTAYKLAHTKTTVGVNEIDVKARRLGYFHNAGYYALEGDDFRDVFLLDGPPHERMLSPYVEFVRWRAHFAPPRGAALVETSVALLRKHLQRVPTDNPFPRFKARFAADLEWLVGSPIERFHAYSFANLRQYGACFELAGSGLGWLAGNGVDGCEEPARHLRVIAETAKAFQFQLARAIARGRAMDLAPIDAMGESWQRAMDGLRVRFA